MNEEWFCIFAGKSSTGGLVAEDNRFSEEKSAFSSAPSSAPENSTGRPLKFPHAIVPMWLPDHEAQTGTNDSSLIQLPLKDRAEVSADEHPEFVPDGQHAFLAEMSDISAMARLRIRAELHLLDIKSRFIAAIRYEREAGNLFNFVPVVLACGIAAYFSAPSERQSLALLASILITLLILVKTESRGAVFLATCSALLFFTGMGAAKLQAERARMPIPLSDMTAKLEGIIQSVDQNRRGAPRYVIRPTRIEGLDDTELPENIRLSASKAHIPLSEGNVVTGLAQISPITGPAYPGGYDFSFAAQMQGLGMSGFFMGAPQPADAMPPKTDLASNIKMSVQRARRNIAERIRAGLPGEAGDIAVALITGDRSGLSAETQESLRRSGLAHILAISGLHMALVTLTVIWLVRLILVSVPGVVDRFPVKKAAIIAGFATASAYLVISGHAIATQRAWLMISVMLIASLLDRRAITMRSVAIAAILILLFSPASLFQPGFQMSFAAVAALVAVYREWSDFRAGVYGSVRNIPDRSAIGSATLKAFGYFGGLATTSLIAGIATALFALWHFHRVAPLGLVSNLAAMPIVSIAVMPLALMAMILMPYGFEQLALKPLGAAIEGVLAVSDKVNSYGLDFDAGIQPLAVLISSALFLVFACGLRSRLRWFSLLPLVALIGVLGQGITGQPARIPDMLIAQDGRTLAINTALFGSAHQTSEPGLALLYPGRGAFISDIWQRAYLPNRKFVDLPDRTSCNKDRCDILITRPENKMISIVYDPDQLASACRETDILIAPRLWWVRCRGAKKPDLILNRSDFEARGSHLLFFNAAKTIVETAWRNPKSEFEKNQQLRDLKIAQTNANSAQNAGGGERGARSNAFSSDPDPVPAARPWQKRFDNISRRFLKSQTRN